MWTIAELKIKAQKTISRDYWKFVLSALILIFVENNNTKPETLGRDLYSILTTYFSLFRGHIYKESVSLLIASIASMMVLVIGLVFVAGVIILIRVLLCNPVYIGVQRFLLLSCFQKPELGEIGFAFKKDAYLNIIKIMFFKDLYTFLWSLLFWIPGIYKSYEYRMIPYLLAENPNIEMKEAFRLSKEMMEGEKLHAFGLDFSFIGWHILNLFTCGILSLFYVSAYISLTSSELYLVLREKAFIKM